MHRRAGSAVCSPTSNHVRKMEGRESKKGEKSWVGESELGERRGRR
jgi:hypothetical protein